MKKRIIIFILSIIVIFNIFSYDEEDYINIITDISTITHNIFDFNISSPTDSYSPEFKFKIGILLNDYFTLGITGNFFNNLEQTKNFYSETYYDYLGVRSTPKQQSADDMFSWKNIDNYLDAYIGYKFRDDLYLGFMLGGGTKISKYESVKNSYNHYFDTDKNIIITNEETDGKETTSESYNGYGYISTGAGAYFKGDFLRADLVNCLRAETTFSFKINGTGAPNGIVALDGNGIKTTGLDGKGDTFKENKTYFVNNTEKEIKYKVKHEEYFVYFGFSNSGNVNTELDFHKISPSLSYLDRFRFFVGVEYDIGFKNYHKSFDSEKKRFSLYPGLLNKDYQFKKTVYNIDYDFNLDFMLPLWLEIKPIKPISMKFYYTLDFDSNYLSYKASYSESAVLNGANQSFNDSSVKYVQNSFLFNHIISTRFRYEFPKVVRLSLGASYILEHSLYKNQFFIGDNMRSHASGNVSSGPYTSQSISDFETGIYPYTNPINTNSLEQFARFNLELDFEFIKDFATLTVGWNPKVKWDWDNPNNEMITASNLLNLANWSISNVIKFDPKKAYTINQKFAPVIKKTDTDDRLIIIHTNDTHGHPLATINGGGLPARATYIKEMKELYKNVIILDAGDINTGNPESTFFNAEPDIIGYNYIGYDAMTIGNHEFDVSIDVLKRQIKSADFPFLSANVKYKDPKTGKESYLGKPYIIKNFKNFKVGIIGLTTKETEIIGNKQNIKNIIFEDEVVAARKVIFDLKKKVNFIICLTHLGIYDEEDKGAKKLANNLPEIDLIIDGHSHTKMTEPLYVNNIPIVQAWKNGMVVGQAILTINNKEITSLNWTPIPINLTNIVRKDDGTKESIKIGKHYEEDRSLSMKLEKYKSKVDKVLSEVIGNNSVDLPATNVRMRETALGNLVADSMKEYTESLGVDFAIQNGGGVRNELLKGAVTKNDIYKTLPFDNTIVVVTLKGKDVIKMFEYIGTIKKGNGAFPQVSNGVTFTINQTKGICENILINGEPIDPNKDYKIATNSYMFEGGDGYEIFKNSIESYDTSVFQRDALIEYIKKHRVINPQIENRIQLNDKTSMVVINNLIAA